VRSGSGGIDLSELGDYMTSMGREMSSTQLLGVLRSLGLELDGTGALSRAQFGELVRQTLLSDLPSQLVDQLRAAHGAAASAAASGLVDRDGAVSLLASIGIKLPGDVPTAELMDAMDADGSGDVCIDEVLVFVGMLRRQQLELAALASVFEALTQSSEDADEPPECTSKRAFLARSASGLAAAASTATKHTWLVRSATTLATAASSATKQAAATSLAATRQAAASVGCPEVKFVKSASNLAAAASSSAANLAVAASSVAAVASTTARDVTSSLERRLTTNKKLGAEPRHDTAAHQIDEQSATRISAKQLARFFGLSCHEAEDVVFLTDLDRFGEQLTVLAERSETCADVSAEAGRGEVRAEAERDEPTVDLLEFQQLIVGW
jgi:Ca2+-binding EF-hand superfamily protein